MSDPWLMATRKSEEITTPESISWPSGGLVRKRPSMTLKGCPTLFLPYFHFLNCFSRHKATVIISIIFIHIQWAHCSWIFTKFSMDNFPQAGVWVEREYVFMASDTYCKLSDISFHLQWEEVFTLLRPPQYWKLSLKSVRIW